VLGPKAGPALGNRLAIEEPRFCRQGLRVAAEAVEGPQVGGASVWLRRRLDVRARGDCSCLASRNRPAVKPHIGTTSASGRSRSRQEALLLFGLDLSGKDLDG